MALTRSFKELVQQHVAADPDFAEGLLREGINLMLAGDVDTGKAILRDYIKATVGFEKLGRADKALDAYERCLKLDPAEPDSIFYLALAYERRGDINRARALYEDLVDEG